MHIHHTLVLANSLREPEDRLGVVLLLELRKLAVQLLTVVQVMGLLCAVRGVDIVEVGTKVGIRLALDDNVVDTVDVVQGRGLCAVVLEHPKGVTVVVCGEVGVLGVDS